MAEEAPKIEHGEAAEPTTTTTSTGTATGAAAADVVASAKVFVETVQTAVLKQGDKVKAKVVGAADDTKTRTTQQGVSVKDKVVQVVGGMLEATKTGVVQGVDKAQGYLNPTTGSTTDPNSIVPAEDKKESS